MNFIFNFFKGTLIGAGAILPGISSGVFCVIFGIYEDLIDSILYFFKDIKKNFKFLFPLAIGAVFGILIFSNFLNFLLYKFPLQTNTLFIGLILGSLPSLIRDTNKKESFRPINILYMIIAFIITILAIIIQNLSISNSPNSINLFYLIICGICMSAGIVIPGVSSTAILMLLKIYSIYIYSVSSLYFPVLIPIGIGIIIGSLAFMKFIKILLNNYYSKTFYSIIGFTIGSTLLLVPNINFDFSAVVSILCILLGFTISNSLSN